MRPARRAGLAALTLLTALLSSGPVRASAAPAPAQPRALLVFVPAPGSLPGARTVRAGDSVDMLLRGLERRRQLAVGLLSATQGSYSPEQELLDISQGSRVSPTAYTPRHAGRLGFAASGTGGLITGWAAVVARARTAPASIRPGRLAGILPGGAAYVGVRGESNVDAVAAADPRGRVATASLGSPGSVLRRTRTALRGHRFVVADLPSDPATASAALDSMSASPRPGLLTIVTERPPGANILQLLPIGVAGPDTAGRGVVSNTTRRDGVVAGIDVFPTIARHLRVAAPAAVTGERIRTADRLSPSSLEQLRERYSHIAPRRIRTLQGLIAAWAALLAGAALVRRTRAALRIGGLAFLWVPTVVLVPAAVDPQRGVVETAFVVLAAFVLGALTDRVVRWPRAPVVPVVVSLAVYLVDLAAGSNLITLSLLGPNPRAGARFYGIGNELEPALPILLFVGLAAAMTGRERSRRLAATFAVSGLTMALIIGSGLLGADVGGVITASVGTVVAALAMLPGRVRRRTAAALFVIVPVAAVAALALLDLVTGAQSHFSRNVLHAHGGSNLSQIVQRRFEFALHALWRGKMPYATAAAIAAAAAGIVYRERLLAPLNDPAWRAALAGGLAAGAAGALANDSGPLLFVVAVFVLGVVTAYIQGGLDGGEGVANLGGRATEDVATEASPVRRGGEVPAGVSVPGRS